MTKRVKEPKPEQLELLSKEQGTGLSTDPDNKAFRRNITKQMLPESRSGYADMVADTLHKSKVPLQHLVDMQRAGTMIARQPLFLGFGGGRTGRYDLSWDGSPGERTIHLSTEGSNDSFSVVHEAGHALHDAMSSQFGNGHGSLSRDMAVRTRGLDNPDAATEGFADGYAERYSRGRGNKSEMGYTGQTFLTRTPDGGYTDEGQAAVERYTRSRREAFTTGAVPYSGKAIDYVHGDALTKWAESAESSGPRPYDERLPGLEIPS